MSPTRRTGRSPSSSRVRASCSRCHRAIVFLGVYPKPMLERIEPSVDALIEHVERRTGETVTEPELVEEDGG